MQVKTSEDKIPWEPKQEDQFVNPKSLQKASDQLQRDALRFMEMIPDINVLRNINIKLRLAFPLVLKSVDDPILTSADIDSGTRLLNNIGIQTQKQNVEIPSSVWDDYKKLTARYLCSHSHVPCKTASEAYKQGLSTLGLAKKRTESGIQSQVKNIVNNGNNCKENLKRTIEKDK